MSTRVYIILNDSFEYAREEWAKDHKLGLNRKESYWQGRKDGLRVAMNLMFQEMSEKERAELK
jgi:hypothetical protein